MSKSKSWVEELESSPQDKIALRKERNLLTFTELLANAIKQEKISYDELDRRIGKQKGFTKQFLNTGNVNLHIYAEMLAAVNCECKEIRLPPKRR